MTKEEFIKRWEFHCRLNWNHVDSNLKEELSNDYDAIAKNFLQPDVIGSLPISEKEQLIREFISKLEALKMRYQIGNDR